MSAPTPGIGSQTELSQAWIQAMRLRGYGEFMRLAADWARAGFVASLGISSRTLLAVVRGPGKLLAQVNLELEPMAESQRKAIQELLSQRPRYCRALLDKRWPEGALAELQEIGSLLPGKSRSIRHKIFGIDDSRCLGAVLLVLAQRLDEDPLALFVWLGFDLERLRKALENGAASQEMEEDLPESDEKEIDLFQRYWVGSLPPQAPKFARKTGMNPFPALGTQIKGQDLAFHLKRMYQHALEQAEKLSVS